MRGVLLCDANTTLCDAPDLDPAHNNTLFKNTTKPTCFGDACTNICTLLLTRHTPSDSRSSAE